MNKIPIPYQNHSIKWLKNRRGKASLLCHEQGLGKTFITCAALTPPAIVVCPAFLQLNWKDELENEFKYTTVIVKSQRDLELYSDVYIMSYHFLTKLDLSIVNAETFIMDEFHYAKNTSAKRTQAAMVEIQCTPTVILLSGTPVPSCPVELFPILESIGAYKRGYYSYVYRFCGAKQTHWGLDVRGSSNLPDLIKIIKPYMLRYTKKQVLKDLPLKTYKVLSQDLQLPPEEKEYKLNQFEDVNPQIAFETMSTVMRIHASLKYPIVVDIVDHHLNTTKDKLIIFAHHLQEMLYPLQDRYGPIAGAVSIVGGMSAKCKNFSVNTFQTVESCRIIIIGIQAGAVGITLTAASRVLMAESSWVPGVIDQATDRAHRIGQRYPVNVDIVTIRGSIDEFQIKRALEKQTVINQLIQENHFMSITGITKQIKSIRASLDAIEMELEEDDSNGVEEETPTRRGRGRPKKAEESTTTRRGRGRPKKAEESSPLDKVRIAASELMKAADRTTLASVLAEFEANKVTDLEEADYEDFIAACEEEIESAAA